MYFVLPDLAYGNPRKGYDTLSATFERGQFSGQPAFIDAPQPNQTQYDYTSRYSATWDMVNVSQDQTLFEPLCLNLSVLGGPRTRRWNVSAVTMDICFQVDDTSRPVYLPSLSVKPGKEPWVLSDTKPFRLTDPGILLWHPDASVASPLRNLEQQIVAQTFKVLLRLRLVNEQKHWRDVLLIWKFAPGSLRLQPYNASTPTLSPPLSTPRAPESNPNQEDTPQKAEQ